MLKKAFIISLIIGLACATVITVAQVNQPLEFKIGFTAQGILDIAYIAHKGGVRSRVFPDSKIANASIGPGIVFEGLWNTKKSSISFSTIFRYARIFTYQNIFVHPNREKYGIAVDAHLSYNYKFRSRIWLLTNSFIGVGVSLINIGLKFENHYDVVFLNPPNDDVHIVYDSSTLMFPGFNFSFTKVFWDKISIKLMGIYSPGNLVQWVPGAKYIYHGNFAIQYSFLKT